MRNCFVEKSSLKNGIICEYQDLHLSKLVTKYGYARAASCIEKKSDIYWNVQA